MWPRRLIGERARGFCCEFIAPGLRDYERTKCKEQKGLSMPRIVTGLEASVEREWTRMNRAEDGYIFNRTEKLITSVS